MPAVALGLDDLTPFEPDINPAKAAVMISDAMATAALIAPCILEDTFQFDGAAKAIIRGAVLRWSVRGTGAVQTEQATAGPFSHMVTTAAAGPGRLFWPTEIADLSKLCGTVNASAFTLDTAPGLAGIHSDICALAFGANYCSCGADIAGFPLYEDSQ